MNTENEKKKLSKNTVLLLVLGIVLLLGIGVALYFAFSGQYDTATGKVTFTPEESFYATKIDVSFAITNPPSEDYTFYYTLDGSPVTENAEKLGKGESFSLLPTPMVSVTVRPVRVAARFADGSFTEESFHTYFLGTKIKSRFANKVVSLTMAPDDFYGETGIWDNYNERGIEWERPVYVTVFDADGQTLLEQHAGVRIHGAWSRTLDVKSLRLYARKEYDTKKYFEYPFFNQEDAYGKLIPKYKRLLLRNSGNDLNGAFIRDAYAQTLAESAGYPDSEQVEPCAVFVNGEYKGFYWLQEYISERYFEATYGKYTGDFEVNDHRDPKAGEYEYYNNEFPELASLDMTKDENYEKFLNAFDLENYVFFYAFNTLIDNEDWPQNNMLAYRYRPAEGEKYGTGVFDGKWRYIIHDCDLSLGEKTNHLSTNCLKEILDPHSYWERAKNISYLAYAPLFAALCEREDFRMLYVNKCKELAEGPLSAENMIALLDEMEAASEPELSFYYKENPAAGKSTLKDRQKQVDAIRKRIPTLWPSLKQQIYDVWKIKVE